MKFASCIYEVTYYVARKMFRVIDIKEYLWHKCIIIFHSKSFTAMITKVKVRNQLMEPFICQSNLQGN